MLVYFEMRDRYEHGDRASFDRARLIRFRDLRERFSGSDCDALFHRWRDLRAAQQATTSPPKTTTERTIPGAFSVCLLEHNYDLFGTLTAA
jgi:hypothetical protein